MASPSSPFGLPLTTADTGWPRVPNAVYEGILIAYVPITITSTVIHLGIKFRKERRLDIDDGFLILALCTSIGAFAFAWLMRDLVYNQMEIVLGMKQIQIQDIESFPTYFKWYSITLTLTWISLYSVKLSFMFFFRRLVARVRSLEIYWRVITGILIPVGLFSAFFGFWTCSDFTVTFLNSCPLSTFAHREETYLYSTTSLDIFTDLLIISVPIALLYRVSISFKRKLFLSLALCLSVFMIIICIIRMGTSKLRSGIIDSTWLGLWTSIETNTAVLMVSMTALRSLYRQSAKPGSATPIKLSKRSFHSAIRSVKLASKVSSVDEIGSKEYSVLPERPERATLSSKSKLAREDVDGELLVSRDTRVETREIFLPDDGDTNSSQTRQWPSSSSDVATLKAGALGHEYGRRGEPYESV